MFCGNIFTSPDLQYHKKNHMKKSQKRFHRVNRTLFLSLSNAFEEQKFIPKISPKNFWSVPCFPKIVCGGQCAWSSTPMHITENRAKSMTWNFGPIPPLTSCFVKILINLLDMSGKFRHLYFWVDKLGIFRIQFIIIISCFETS